MAERWKYWDIVCNHCLLCYVQEEERDAAAADLEVLRLAAQSIFDQYLSETVTQL